MDLRLFAYQVFLPLAPTYALRDQLRAMIETTGEGASFEQKARHYHAVASALSAYSSYFDRGVWDYVEDPTRAELEFGQWCEGTVVDARAAADERAGAGDVYRRPAQEESMFVTLLFLMRKGGSSDRYVCELCRMPESDYFTRTTFDRLLKGIAGLNFPSIRADAVYVRPSRGELGVTGEELAEVHYDYVRKIT